MKNILISLYEKVFGLNKEKQDLIEKKNKIELELQEKRQATQELLKTQILWWLESSIELLNDNPSELECKIVAKRITEAISQIKDLFENFG